VGDIIRKKTFKKKAVVGAAHLVIRQLGRLTLARETLGELPESRVVLEEVAVVVHVSVRRGRVSLEVGRIRVPGRGVHDVLVHREVVAPAVPEAVPQLATVRPLRGLGQLRRGQRKAGAAPLLRGRRERVGRGRGLVRVRRGRGRAALRGVCAWAWVPTAAAAVPVRVVGAAVWVMVMMAVVVVVTALATVRPVTAMRIGWRTISAPTAMSTWV